MKSTILEKPIVKARCIDAYPIPERLFLLIPHLDRINMRWPVHIRAEDDPLHVGRKSHIRFEAVVVIGKIDQFLNLKHPVLWSEKIDPLAVARGGDAARPPAVSRENPIVRRNIEMH